MALAEDLIPEDLTEPFQSLAKELGVGVVIKLSQSLGGETVYIPRRRFGAGHRVVKAIGETDSERFRRLCVEQFLYINVPTLKSLEQLLTHRQIREAIASGEKVADIAKRFQISRLAMNRHCRKAGIN